jgi:hypothetical protein
MFGAKPALPKRPSEPRPAALTRRRTHWLEAA